MHTCALFSRLFRAALLGLVGFLFLAGCQTTNPKTQAASDQWRMMSLEENFLEFKETQKKESAQAAQNAEMLKKRLMTLEEQMAALRNEMAETKEALKDASMQTLQPKPVFSGTRSSEKRPWANVPAPGPTDTPKVSSKKKRARAKVVTPKRKAVRKTSSATALYEKGQRLATSENVEAARKVLDSFLAKYPNNKLVPNALYWKGETYYAQKDYPQAILAFKDVTQRFPTHSKAQAALLKIGMSYKNVGDTDNAVFYLRTLVDEHPGSGPAKLARKLLEEIPG